MPRSLLSAIALVAAAALVRADAFDDYTNPLLLKAAASNT